MAGRYGFDTLKNFFTAITALTHQQIKLNPNTKSKKTIFFSLSYSHARHLCLSQTVSVLQMGRYE
jgi:hypothetical protein